jgi:thiamine-phosphate pyrophosphorylase
MLISDRLSAHLPLADVAAQAFAAGCRWMLIREKDLPDEQLTVLMWEIMALAKRHGAAVSVSSNAHVAAACNAQGIHLPRGSVPALARKIVGQQMLIGVSAHSLSEAQQAATDGADYVSLSPIFPSKSKPGYGPALGLDILRHVAASIPIPVVALGGVSDESAKVCLQAGAAGVAVMGSVMRSPQPGNVVETLFSSLKPH